VIITLVRTPWVFVCAASSSLAMASMVVASSAHAADALAEAKELFRRGVVLFEAGDMESALDAFRRSRALFASMQNTLNVGICLEALARYDEALDAYEDVVAGFGAELGDAERASLTRKLQGLRAKVGALDVSSNVNGAVVVDGRERAKLPLGAPIRVTAGTHVVRVIKDGYVTFEAEVLVRAGERTAVDASLLPLASEPRDLAARAGLAVDPRWPEPSGHFVFGAFVGYGIARSLRSSAEEGCSGGACTRHGIPGGVMVGLRGGYELRSGITVEGAGGYLSFASRVSRAVQVDAGGAAPTTYAIDDALRVQGFWLGTSVSYAARLDDTLTLRPRLGAGFLVAHAFDSVSATATRGASTTDATLANGDDITRTTPFIGTAELWLERRWGTWRIGAGLTALWLPSPAARGLHGELAAPGAPSTTAIAGERYYASLLVVMPQISVALTP
jgi:hypothetical protein